ncbi:arylsulfatase [Halieaceae bacterium IMCC14734]|uniref:Arylsulfatase n=1 Tax=Candidatus Litorirhabdus singularis TaxID=2518993 RepID=A0ABT3TL21_9GAMM|nr:arylsulfatase [Candidatus Litorirhabdus singularis]MCX2982950.1 arylsulfatase [Candidatus Litorirhabdus singularis]
MLGLKLAWIVAIGGLLAALGARDAGASGLVLPAPAAPAAQARGLTVGEVPRDGFSSRSAPAGAPNVLVVLLDDVGFAAASTFGGLVPTPYLTQLAEGGLSYNRFHTTAICSPTRASLMTGRNPHAVGVGSVINSVQPWRGRSGLLQSDTATIAEILRLNGYATGMFGKWHLTPDHEASPMGPFDRWPTQQGFETFYGFLGGETHQFEPTLFAGTQLVQRPAGDNYHVTSDLTERSIDWIKLQQSLRPEQPFFLYLAPGATHAPLHAPKAWIDKFAGQFDRGWDVAREKIFARQLELGVIPPGTELTPRPPELRAWDTLDSEEQQVAARLMEVYAGFLAHTDAEVGRVLESLREQGLFDNTLVFYIVGDNGASGEGGGDYGTWNEMGRIQGIVQSPAELLKRYDEIGGTDSYPHYSAGWAWATNTPFRWVKQVASHLGGTRNPLVVSWPDGIAAKDELRTQFSHVNDIFPTVLEAAKLPAPALVNGIGQKPLDGFSLLYSFDDAVAPEVHATQYFEVRANRALYHKGWMVSSRNENSVPWHGLIATDDQLPEDKWELYDLRSDFSQAKDVARENPRQLQKLVNLFWAEAGRNQVLPLSGRPSGEPPFAPLGAGRSAVSYYPGAVGLHETAIPSLKNRSHSITARIAVPEIGASGVIATQGGVVAGWALYVNEEGHASYVYNLAGKSITTISADQPLKPGPAQLALEFDYDGGGYGRGADLVLKVDGKRVARGRIERSIPAIFSIDETFDVGTDTGSPAGHYPANFAFTGTIEEVRIAVDG